MVLSTSTRKVGLCWALAASIALQCFILYYQLNYGWLVGLIPWDDCAIVLRSLENLDKLAQSHSLWHMLGAALRLDIHAPVSDIQTLAGMLLAGGAIWGPYALNVTYLCIAICAISTTVALKEPLAFGTSVLFLLVQPITFRALAGLLSDWQGGILLAAAMVLLFDAAEENNNYGRTLGAALLGLTLITKMTAFYLPVLVLGVFAAFEFYGAVRRKVAAKNGSKSSPTGWERQRTMCVGLILLPYLLFFFYSHKPLLAYIHNALGPLWRDGFTIPERLLFYSPFGGHLRPDVPPPPWGELHFIFLIFLVAGFIATVFKRDWLHVLVCTGVVLIAAMFLTPLVLAPTSAVSFGGPFLGAIMGGTLISLRIFVLNTPSWGALVAPVIVLALALPGPLPLGPPLDQNGMFVGREELKQYQSINDDMAGMIAQRETSARPEVVFTFDHNLMPYPDLSIRHFQRTGRFLSIDRIDDFADHDAASLLTDADFVITITPVGGARTVPNLSRGIPTSADPALGDARVREIGRYGLIVSYQIRSGEIRLYQAGAPR
jgi:hypothetical protein